MDGKRFRKRALALAAATVTTVSALSLGMGGTTNAATFPLGDVNLDGKVNLKDAQLALKGALCIIKLDDTQFRAADVNKDNKVNLKDAQKILKGALMIEKIEGEISDTTTTTPPISTEKPIEPTETAVPTTAPTIQPTEEPIVTDASSHTNEELNNITKSSESKVEIKWDCETSYYAYPEQITTLQDGTQIITTPNEGIEGIDWEWKTAWQDWVYCGCGKNIAIDEHGYCLWFGDGDGAPGKSGAELHSEHSIHAMNLLIECVASHSNIVNGYGFITDLLGDEQIYEEVEKSCGMCIHCGNYIYKPVTLTYKVRLK